MRFPPIRNATLTQVRAGGGAEDYDQPTSEGAVKWSGIEEVFVNDQELSDDTGQRSSVLIRRSVVVDDALPVNWARGDTLIYTYRNTAQTGIVRDIKITSAPRRRGVVRLLLEDA